MEIDSWLREAKKQIDSLDAELIALESFAPKGADRSWLVANNVVKITTDRQKKAEKMLKRRVAGEPLAYILGKKEFYGREFRVNSRVLIPRPETEGLIDLIKELDLPKRPDFLEIGTGSGCIAITLALEFPQSYVLASDISRKALDVARENDLRHEGRVDLVQANLLQGIEFGEEGEHFDVVVANLPYVSRDWKWVSTENLQFEPKCALYARGNNGLSVYQRFFRELALRKQNELWVDYVVVEADPCQQAGLCEIGEKYGFVHVKTVGYGMVFEDTWRYWWDAETQKFGARKPQDVLAQERRTGKISYLPEE